MATVLDRPGIDELGDVVGVLRGWQHDDAPLQLHPGDLGWFWRFGPESTAAALRTWSRGGRILAVALLDGANLLRLAIAPDRQHDYEFALQLCDDVSTPERGVLTQGMVYVEAPLGAAVRDVLGEQGWMADAARTPLRLDLATPLHEPDLRIDSIDSRQAHLRCAVQRASFERSTFTEERWRMMARGLPYVDGRCLVAYDEHDTAVAAVTVWSAGPGRPGLLEPMGVHRDHRRHGYGKAITAAAAAALKSMGSSSAVVCTARANLAAIATYRAAGFEELANARDLRRDA